MAKEIINVSGNASSDSGITNFYTVPNGKSAIVIGGYLDIRCNAGSFDRFYLEIDNPATGSDRILSYDSPPERVEIALIISDNSFAVSSADSEGFGKIGLTEGSTLRADISDSAGISLNLIIVEEDNGVQ